MEENEIVRQVTDMANSSHLDRFTPAELGGLLIHVLTDSYDGLSEKAVSALLLVSSSLMRDHCETVEKDILAARKIYQRR